MQAKGKIGGGEVDESQLNARLEGVVQELQAILEDAQSAGVYDDNESVQGLEGLLEGSQAILTNWMGDSDGDAGELGEAIMGDLGDEPQEAAPSFGRKNDLEDSADKPVSRGRGVGKPNPFAKKESADGSATVVSRGTVGDLEASGMASKKEKRNSYGGKIIKM
jgi:hypothetical protein